VRLGKTISLLISVAIALPVGVRAYDINDQLSVGGILAGAYQYQDLSGDRGADDSGRGAVVFQPKIRFTPTENDEIFAKLGFAAGNGLNEISPFVVTPWAADLEDDVREINGRTRDYLLTAWYKHRFEISENNILSLTGGLIDATDYLDDNAHSNHEYTQFMNAALVKASNGFFPSYDIGIGYAYLDGGNLDIDRTQVAEMYARFQLNRFFAFTVDLQYMQDDLVDGSASKGLIYGLRLTAAF